MTQKRTAVLATLAALALVGACSDNDLTPVTSMFGSTMKAAFALGPTDEPLTSAQIQVMSTDIPLSLTTDPIDL